MLATFLGAVIYALVSIALISASVFQGRSIAVSFFLTVFVIVLAVFPILSWIEWLSRLASAGCRPDSEAAGELHRQIFSNQFGHVKNVDVGRIRTFAQRAGCDIRLRAQPGSFVAPGTPLAEVADAVQDAAIRDYFTIGDAREFDQDPRFGVIVLSEIASRPLSPGTNDPSTTIDIIGRPLSLLCLWRAR